MEGWRMILLVNGGLGLFMALSTLAVSGLVRADAAATMRAIAAWLAAAGLLLLLLGVFIKRRRRPPQP